MQSIEFDYFLEALMNLHKFQPSQNYLDIIYDGFMDYFEQKDLKKLQKFMDNLLHQYPKEECWNDVILGFIELLLDCNCMDKIYEENQVQIGLLQGQLDSRNTIIKNLENLTIDEYKVQKFMDDAYQGLTMERQINESTFTKNKLDQLQKVFVEFQQKVSKITE
ncbi:hypothetical protein SS50377_20298 [Spironucleus salmonicida]|uniref:Uncharacterized protein n=1 Tax=Spironucleus salmonicida TaxID=348837 RepID=V6LLB9_9EUKA|nr:hypothetical protein SS50377_20298 [Spironucleus salmonicida]|eukprot:EST45352.1 Hypothetical protein SS50377_14932 [Spironucleus salmonicida]